MKKQPVVCLNIEVIKLFCGYTEYFFIRIKFSSEPQFIIFSFTSDFSLE